ncbi:hypothetical protein Dsin_002417 [Dipteronia sinensis]|uniref:RNase H type-1 domain-containing protein n=1 Tax=Dipteronia sinensis TaxID=43782 RepID=A0AAE0B668_9ROSI|nr:hypothetical protein Dsin_002417 [Dipteronia sinensis]
MVTLHNKKVWRMTGFYGNPKAEEHHHTWKLLRRLKGMSLLLYLRVGNFNEILSNNEKQIGVLRQRRLDGCELDDMGFRGRMFTWSNMRKESELVLERLDCGVQSLEWHKIFPNSFLRHLNFWHSDHRPLLVEVLYQNARMDMSGLCRRRRFHFESCRVDCDDCKLLPLSAVSKSIEPRSWKEIRRLEGRLDSLLAEVEDYWKQRSMVEWLNGGDRNTKFFHLKVSARRARNVINGLFGAHDNWCERQSDIHGVVVDYFSGLFKIEESPAADVEQDTIGGSVVVGCLRCLNEGESLSNINEALICLIPKIMLWNELAISGQSVYITSSIRSLQKPWRIECVTFWVRSSRRRALDMGTLISIYVSFGFGGLVRGHCWELFDNSRHTGCLFMRFWSKGTLLFKGSRVRNSLGEDLEFGLKEIWDEVTFMKGFRGTAKANFIDLFGTCLHSLENGEFEFLCVILWRIWFLRNQDVLHIVKWQPLDFGLYKLNTDAAVDVSSLRVGMEDLTTFHGLTFALDLGLISVVIESDDLEVVNLINSGDNVSAEIDLIIWDIRDLLFVTAGTMAAEASWIKMRVKG